MRMSLLEIVQYILSDIDSDEVNSINDTVESEQVARIVRTTYLAWMAKSNWPHLKKLFSLNPFSSLERPTFMSLPEGVKEIEWINYEATKTDLNTTYFKTVQYKDPEEFLRLSNMLNLQGNVQETTTVEGIKLRIKNDADPSFYTSFDDKIIIFDSFNKGVEDSLQESKTQVSGWLSPSFEMVDDFIPDLPTEAFPGLYQEALSTASLRLAQNQDVKAEREAQRQRYWMARKNWRVEGGIQYPNYGRGRRK